LHFLLASSPPFPSIFALGLAGAGLLLANHALGRAPLVVLGVIFSGLAALLLEAGLLHPGDAFNLWPTAAPDDRWLALACLSLGGALLSRRLARFPRWREMYEKPLWILSGASFAWVFATAMLLLFSGLAWNRTSAYGPWLFLIQTAALFPLLKPLPESARIRGVGVLILLTGFAVSLLSLAGVTAASGGVGLAWAFILLTASMAAAPRFNARWPRWRVSPETWPRVGLALACLAAFDTGERALAMFFNPGELFAPLNPIYLIACAAYCALMRRDHAWKGLPWIFSTCVTIVACKFIAFGLGALGMYSFSSQWLILAPLATGLAALAWRIARGGANQTGEEGEWKRALRELAPPLKTLAVICLVWSLLGVSLAMSLAGSLRGDLYPPLVFLILIPGLVFLLHDYSDAFRARSVGVITLLSAAWFSGLAAAGIDNVFGAGAIAWAFILRGLDLFAAPSFNKRLPAHRLEHASWRWLGLAFLIPVPALSSDAQAIFTSWFYWLLVSIHLFLLLKDHPRLLIHRLAAGALTAAGVLLVHKAWAGALAPDPSWFILGALAWANLLLCATPVSRRYGSSIAARLGWSTDDLAAPFFTWAAMIPWVCLTLPGIIDPLTSLGGWAPTFNGWSSVWIWIALPASFLHIFHQRKTAMNAHGFIFSLFCLIWTAKIHHPAILFQPPLLLALWSAALLAVHILQERQKDAESRHHAMARAVSQWATFSPWSALALLPVTPVKTLAETLAVLALTAGVMAALGWRRRRPFLLRTARILGLILLHTWPLFFVPSKKAAGLMLWQIWPLLVAKFDQLQMLFPWWALQMTLLAWAGLWFERVASERLQHKFPRLKEIDTGVGFITLLAVGEWILHLLVFINNLYSGPVPNAWLHGVAALAAALLLTLLGARHIRQTGTSTMFYPTALMVGAAGLYLRLLLVGLAPLGLPDAMALMAAAYGLFMALRFTASPILARPLRSLTLATPLPALLIIAIQGPDAHVCAVLLAAGALYLSFHYAMGGALPLYMGALAVNGALYLWIPGWSHSLNLIQLYAAPAAVSVLILLHLHRRELKKSVLNGARLAAISVLYTCAFIDFFLQPDLSNFILAMCLSLIGVIIGVSLRIRAFLYGGSVFMVMNVLIQMIRYYPKEGLGKGVFLVLLGTLITGSMIAFNLRRESILGRMRLFQADLHNWE
ncbi:MAG: hypothetical protein GY859_24660, partial [Desulfobacterales bacterium]|nr:hypothetical protein [Desulfobacterales bacterium]